jgi:hypothetical protein
MKEKGFFYYRPIALLNSFSNIFEKIMQTRLFKHLHNNNYLCRERYGFLMKLTTENATYTLTNEVLNVLNNKLIVGVIFCNLKKAFGCVNHYILLPKLKLMEQLVKTKISMNLTLKANIKEF